MPKEHQPDQESEVFGITDDYMFFTVVQDDSLCARLLRELLPFLKIKEVASETQKEIKNTLVSKAIRLDVQATDENQGIYDLEMQMSSKFEHKRARYYRAVIDANQIRQGKAYDTLPPAIVIVLSPFPNVDSKQKICCFRTYCPEASIGLNDQSLICLVNSKGTEGEVSPTLQKFLDLMNGQVDTSDDFIKEVYEKMCEFSKDQSWQADHLAYIGEQSHIRFEGQQEGLVQGKKRVLQKVKNVT